MIAALLWDEISQLSVNRECLFQCKASKKTLPLQNMVKPGPQAKLPTNTYWQYGCMPHYSAKKQKTTIMTSGRKKPSIRLDEDQTQLSLHLLVFRF